MTPSPTILRWLPIAIAASLAAQRPSLLHDPRGIRWLDDARVTYTIDTATGRQLVVVGIDDGRVERASIERDDARAAAVDANGALFILGERGVSRRPKSAWGQPGSSVPAAEATVFHIAHRPDLRRSGNGRGETGVLFANDTDDEVRLRWIDQAGERRDYGTVAAHGTRWQHTLPSHAWEVVDTQGEVLGRFRAGDTPGIARVPASPPKETDAQPRRRRRGARAFVRDHDLWLRDAQGRELVVAKDGDAAHPYRNPQLSPDGKTIAAQRVDLVDKRVIHLIESAPEAGGQPVLHAMTYPKPGDPRDHPHPRIFRRNGSGFEAIPIDESLFANPYQLRRFGWSEEGRELRFVYNQRGHQVLRWVGIDARTGKVRTIVENASETFVDYSQKLYLHELDGSFAGKALWMSERSGWNHLELVDIAAGTTQPLTSGEWVVRSVEHVDDATGVVTLRILGHLPQQDPYHVHFARLDLATEQLTVLTEGDGTHLAHWSPDRRWFVDIWSRVDHPPVAELRDGRTGALLSLLERADDSALRATGWHPPERFVAPGRDGETPIWGIVHWPTPRPDAAKAIPLLEHIYAGPHGHHVPKSWRARRGEEQFTSRGFAVVQIDGMGTNWRSKAFHDVCWQDLADAGFADRRPWIRALAETFPELDLDRVGIYGGSAGGQNAMRALIDHSTLYKAAAADCGCHDNRMDKMWWNEAWMGWPVGEHYAASSNVDHAFRMRGHLLLTVGELDRNVDPASTMQVVNALIHNGLDFELVVIPGEGHGAGERPYGRRRRLEFFERHLK